MVSREGIIAVYMMASGQHGTLYIGVTSNLNRRIWEHREGVGSILSKGTVARASSGSRSTSA